MAPGAAVEIEEAVRMIGAAAVPLAVEGVPVDTGAAGRILAEEVRARESLPPFDSSAMDGFAVRSEDLRGACAGAPAALRLVDESRAGAPARRDLGAGEAIAISTGAVLPAGADAVVRVEHASRQDGRVEVVGELARGANVRRAGEDIRAGTTALSAGTRLGPVELGVLASLGCTRVSCSRRPRVSVLVTGDELLAPGEELRAGAIRDSSTLSLCGLVRAAGCELVRAGRTRDARDETRAAVASAVEGVDVAVIAGGVSVGEHDHVRPALAELGAREVFWGVALRPGHPAWFGTLDGTLVFGLPGNPVSAIVTFVLLVAPALDALTGAAGRPRRASAVLDSDYEKPPGRTHAVRCRLQAREDGWHATPTGPQGSHILTSMLGADALAIIPSEASRVAAGERVEIELLDRWRWGGP